MTGFKIGDRVRYINANVPEYAGKYGIVTRAPRGSGISVQWDGGDVTSVYGGNIECLGASRPLVGPAPKPVEGPRIQAPFTYVGGSIRTDTGHIVLDLMNEVYDDETIRHEFGEFVAEALNVLVEIQS